MIDPKTLNKMNKKSLRALVSILQLAVEEVAMNLEGYADDFATKDVKRKQHLENIEGVIDDLNAIAEANVRKATPEETECCAEGCCVGGF